MEQQKIPKSEKMEVPPQAPGMKESVDKCTEKKRYSDSMKLPTCTIMY